MAKYPYTSKMDILVKNKGDGLLELSCFINGRPTTANEILFEPGEQIIISRETVSDAIVRYDTTINLDPSGDEKSATKVEYKTRFN